MDTITWALVWNWGFSLSTLNPAYLPALMLSWIQHKLKRLLEPAKLRGKYTHFRILVIGRANAGKTTLLKRVCNTTEDPCIYDEKNNNLVSYLIRRLSFTYQPSAVSSNRLHKYQLISLSGFYQVDHWFQFCSGEYMIFVVHSPSRAILASYSMIRQDLRLEVRRNSRTCRLS